MTKDIKNAFTTHFNYIQTLHGLSNDLTIDFLEKNVNHKDTDQLQKKLNLLKLMKKSLNDDNEIIHIDAEYAVASCVWMPIKAYYLVFHTLSVVYYLLGSYTCDLKLGHGKFKKHFKSLLDEKKIVFSQALFNEIANKQILKKVSKSGANLRNPTSENYKEFYAQIMKKLINYTLKNFKEKEEQEKEEQEKEEQEKEEQEKEKQESMGDDALNKSKEKDKSKKPKKKDKSKEKEVTVCILDYFYLMRDRLNYKNSSFLHKISCEEAKQYCDYYYKFVSNFLTPFEQHISSKINLNSNT